MNDNRDAEIHKLIGGALCLDFVNTLNGHRDGPLRESQHEYLADYRDLVLWSRHAGILTEKEVEALLKQAASHPSQARCLWNQAIKLRETLYRIFKCLADDVSPKRSDLQMLNLARSKVLARSHIVPKAGGFIVEWQRDCPAPAEMLSAVVLSAAELITSDELEKLRECDGEACDWLFVDRSRNHLRRWCSMEQCGNRAKSRRQYERGKKLTAA